MNPKVFCIGFHKTGTTSLKVALEKLGYRVTGPNGVNDPNIGENVLSMARGLTEEFDAFQDNPWPIIYKELDSWYPGSRFILSLRNPESWIKSQVGHFGKRETPMRKWIYGSGCPAGNEEVYLKRFERHNSEVLDYFAKRPNDLLVMDLAEGDSWQKLCPFLGTQIPDTPFPRSNTAGYRKKKKSPLVQLSRKLENMIKRK